MINEHINDFMYQTDFETPASIPCIPTIKKRKKQPHHLSPNKIFLQLIHEAKPTSPQRTPKLHHHKSKQRSQNNHRYAKKLQTFFKNPLIQVSFPPISHSPVIKPALYQYSRASQLTPLQSRPYKYSVILETFHLSSTT